MFLDSGVRLVLQTIRTLLMNSPLTLLLTCSSSYILSLLWDNIDAHDSGVFHPRSPETFLSFMLTRSLRFDGVLMELLLSGAFRRVGVTFD